MAILGARGYVGREFIRLLATHPHLELVCASSRALIGGLVYLQESLPLCLFASLPLSPCLCLCLFAFAFASLPLPRCLCLFASSLPFLCLCLFASLPLGLLASWPLGLLASWPLGLLASWPLGLLASLPLSQLAYLMLLLRAPDSRKVSRLWKWRVVIPTTMSMKVVRRIYK